MSAGISQRCRPSTKHERFHGKIFIDYFSSRLIIYLTRYCTEWRNVVQPPSWLFRRTVWSYAVLLSVFPASMLRYSQRVDGVVRQLAKSFWFIYRLKLSIPIQTKRFPSILLVRSAREVTTQCSATGTNRRKPRKSSAMMDGFDLGRTCQTRKTFFCC